MWLALLAAAPLSPLTAQWEGMPIVAIYHRSADPQQPPMDSPSFQRLLVQMPGEPFSQDKIRESIQHLFATGRFADIQVDAQQENSGVILTFLTESRYFIGSVLVRGVPPPPTENQLHSATQLQLGHLFVPEDIQSAMDGLRRVLEDEGYFQTQIVPAYQRHPETQQVDITFDVQVGERARLGQVIVTGTPAFSAERLAQQAEWEQGKKTTSSLVQDGLTRIREFYREADFLGARIRIVRKVFHPETNRTDLELDIDAGKRVTIAVSGAPISRSKIEQLVPIYEEGTLDEDLIEEGERNLQSYFESEGYFDAKVNSVRETSGTEDIAIDYQVELGLRQSLREIQILGNHYFRTETLQERMRIEPARWRLPYGRFSTGMLEQDLAAVRMLYQANGFPEMEIVAALEREHSDSKTELMVTLQVQEGPQVRIGEFSITGNESFPAERLEGLINAASGQPYSEPVVASDRDALLNFYFNAGFPGARFQWKATPSEDSRRMNLQYVIEEGSREYVKNIFVDGLLHTRRGIVNRQLQFRDGDPLSQSVLLDTQRRLYDLGLFSQVEMAIQNSQGRENNRNVLIYLEEAPRYTLRVGLGADFGRFGGSSGDSTQVEGKIEVSPNISLDFTQINVGGRPHTLGFRSRISSLQKRAALTYSAPRFLNYPWLNASARTVFDETRDVRTFTSRRVEESLQFESKRSRITTLWTRYAFRRITVDTGSLRISPDQIPIVSRPVLVGMLSQSWIRDTRDIPTDAQQGMFTTADAGIASQFLGSQTNFVRLVLQNSSYHRFAGRLLLARSSQFGMQTPFGKSRRVEIPGQKAEIFTREIPIAEHFFAGGGNSHRGFAVNQAGPRDPVTGFAVGGNALLLNSLELRFPLWGQNLSGVLFHDAGNLFARLRDLSFRPRQKEVGDLRYISQAVGFGLRYQTPVGPVRFDLGYNLNPPQFRVQTEEGLSITQTLSRWQVLFSIGQSF
ncbi:MAG: outer membrane protein assembly factor BamA [Acidobacteria bacterium]|nr:outer membrane protein assembly factor BamA [Acidobacteriota bacterium]